MGSTPSQRKLAAILCADVAGYSRLMGEDEHATLDALTACRTVFFRHVEDFGGRIVNAPGDSILAEFGSVTDAVSASVEIQRELAERNAEQPGGRRMDFRIGVNLGDVLTKEGDLYGDGVNVAARIQALAEVGGISISDTVYNAVRGKLPLEFDFQGEQRVKNIENPVRTYRVLSKPGAAAHRVVRAHRIFKRHWKRTLLGAAAIVLIAGAGALAFRAWGPAQESAPTTGARLPAIAVLPFQNLSGDPEQDYFADGISEELITELTRFRNLLVIARNSAFKYKGKHVDVRQIGSDLGVQYVLEGSVRRIGERTRITAQLVNADTGAHAWAESYDRPTDDVFAIQDEITREIVGKLGVQVERAELERKTRTPPRNMNAYDLVLEARQLVHNMSPANDARARDLLQRATELDPDYASPHAELSWIYLSEFRFGWNAGPLPLNRALDAARRAVHLDPENGFTHWRLAKIHFYRKELEQFEIEMRRALALNSNHAEILADAGIALMFLHHFDESYEFYRRAIRLDPNGPPWVHFIASNYFYQKREYSKALEAALQITMPGFYWAPFWRAITYAQLGRIDEARTEAAELLRLKPNFAFWQEPESHHGRPGSADDHIADGAVKAGIPVGVKP